MSSEPAPTLLDTEVTSDHLNPPGSYHDWKVTLQSQAYLRASSVYSHLDNRDGTRRHARLRQCRTVAWFARNRDSGQVRVLSNGCKLRWCPLCAGPTRFFVTDQVLTWLSHQPQPKFLTLTLKHSPADLGYQLDSLYNFFRQLKKSALWRKNVAGGIWFFQVKLSKKDDQWHPHLHLMLNSSYIPQKRLSDLWHKITGTSTIVDIRAVTDSRKAASYVARYCSQPANISEMPFHAAVDCVDQLHKRRLCGTLGSARGLRLRTGSPTDKSEWQNVGTWWTVSQSKTSDANARMIWKAWREGLVLDDDVTCSDADQFLDGKDDEIAELHRNYDWQGAFSEFR